MNSELKEKLVKVFTAAVPYMVGGVALGLSIRKGVMPKKVVEVAYKPITALISKLSDAALEQIAGIALLVVAGKSISLVSHYAWQLFGLGTSQQPELVDAEGANREIGLAVANAQHRLQRLEVQRQRQANELVRVSQPIPADAVREVGGAANPNDQIVPRVVRDAPPPQPAARVAPAANAEAPDNRLREAEENLQRLTAQLGDKTREIAQLMASRVELVNSNAELSKTIDELKSELHENEGYIVEFLEQLNQAEAGAMQLFAELQTQLREREQEVVELREKLANANAEVAALKDAVANHKLVLDAAEAEKKRLQSLYEGSVKENTAVLSQAREKEGIVNQLTSELTELNRQLHSLKASPEADRQKLAEQRELITQLRVSRDNTVREIKALYERIEQQEASVEALQMQLSTARASLNALTEESAKREALLTQAQNEVASWQRRHDEIVAERTRQAAENAQLKKEIEAKRTELLELSADVAEKVQQLDAMRSNIGQSSSSSTSSTASLPMRLGEADEMGEQIGTGNSQIPPAPPQPPTRSSSVTTARPAINSTSLSEGASLLKNANIVVKRKSAGDMQNLLSNSALFSKVRSAVSDNDDGANAFDESDESGDERDRGKEPVRKL